jgi:hypothetical protein
MFAAGALVDLGAVTWQVLGVEDGFGCGMNGWCDRRGQRHRDAGARRKILLWTGCDITR